MSNKKQVSVNLNTLGGAKAFISDLRKTIPQQLKSNHSQIQGFKSRQYHLRKIENLYQRAQAGDKSVVNEIRKYATRGGKHKKVVDVVRKNDRWIYKREITSRTRRTQKQSSILSFYMFIERWAEIHNMLLGMGTKNAPLTTFIFGIGKTYEEWRDRLSDFLGLSIQELIKYLNWAKEIYLFRFSELRNSIDYAKSSYNDFEQAIENDEEDFIVDELERVTNHLYKEVWYWASMYEIPIDLPERYNEEVLNFMYNWLPEPNGVGLEVINLGW